MDLFSLTFQYVALIQQPPYGPILYIPLILILVDVVTGILASFKQGVFAWKKLFTFLSSNVAPYLAVVAGVFLVYLLSGSALATQVSLLFGVSAHTLSMLGSIYENLKELGVPAPVMQEVEQVGNAFFQGYPPVMRGPNIPPAPVYVPPIEKQPTQVQPVVPEPVRVSTPPPPVVETPPAAVIPPVPSIVDPMPALLPQGL